MTGKFDVLGSEGPQRFPARGDQEGWAAERWRCGQSGLILPVLDA